MKIAERLNAPPTRRAKNLVSKLRVPCLFSNSVKIKYQFHSAERWLITLPAFYCATSAREAVAWVLSDFCKFNTSPFLMHRNDITAIHIGLDAEPFKEITKLYVEYEVADRGTAYDAIKSSRGKSELHTYRTVDLRTSLSQIDLAPTVTSHVYEIYNVAPAKIHVLEVTSNATLRKSVDINISDLSIDEQRKINPTLETLTSRISGQDHLRLRLASAINHFALGTDEKLQPFLTLYATPDWLEPS